jgi:hypothetical protein
MSTQEQAAKVHTHTSYSLYWNYEIDKNSCKKQCWVFIYLQYCATVYVTQQKGEIIEVGSGKP